LPQTQPILPQTANLLSDHLMFVIHLIYLQSAFGTK
jgi:hypothetical protein